MKAAVYRGKGDVQVQEWPKPTPGEGEVLIRIAAAGICGSDAAEYGAGPQLVPQSADGGVNPLVLGHEFAGTIEDVGTGVLGFEVGARVVCGAGVSCGECVMCRRGRTNLCRTNYHTLGLQKDGGLAEYVVAPANIVYDASGSGLSLDTLALAQPMAVAVHAVRRSGLTVGQDAVIVGVGGIGAFLTYAAVATGARVLVVDLDPERLELAATLGAFATMQPDDGPIVDKLAELGMDAEVFFEVTGSTPGLESVLAAAQPGAVIVPVGIQKRPQPLPLGSWTLREYTVIGTVALVFAIDLPEAVRLLGTRADWTDFTREVIPLEALVSDGLEPLAAGQSRQIKTLVDPWIDAPRPPVHTA